MSKIKIIYVTIGVWVVCCGLAVFYYLASLSTMNSISLWDKLAIFTFFRFPFWLLGLLAVVSLEILVLKPFYQKLNTSFVIGSLGGLIYYFVMTDYFDKKINIHCSDCVERFGFPFHYFQRSDFGHSAGILWGGLIANILTALVFSLVIGLVFRSVWSLISERRLNLK